MNIRLLKTPDINKLEQYLSLHKAECMFICSNLKEAGIEYNGADLEGEYFGYFNSILEQTEKQLLGIIVHYWNGNIIMYASSQTILEQLTEHLKKNTKRSIAGVLGPSTQAEYVIKSLGISDTNYNINRD